MVLSCAAPSFVREGIGMGGEERRRGHRRQHATMMSAMMEMGIGGGHIFFNEYEGRCKVWKSRERRVMCMRKEFVERYALTRRAASLGCFLNAKSCLEDAVFKSNRMERLPLQFFKEEARNISCQLTRSNKTAIVYERTVAVSTALFLFQDSNKIPMCALFEGPLECVM